MSTCTCKFDEATSTLYACTQTHADAFRSWIAKAKESLKFRVSLVRGPSSPWWQVEMTLAERTTTVAAFRSWAEAITWTTGKTQRNEVAA